MDCLREETRSRSFFSCSGDFLNFVVAVAEVQLNSSQNVEWRGYI